MKLKNLLFATMIACAFASCSNDDDPINDGGNEGDTKADATLYLSVSGLKAPTTKADNDNDASNEISNLVVAVFNNGAYTNGTGTDAVAQDGLVLVKDFSGDNLKKSYDSNTKEEYYQMDGIILKEGGVKIVVFANVAASVFSSSKNLSEFESVATSFTGTGNAINEENGKLTMSSDIISLTLKPGDNYAGYTHETVDAAKNIREEAILLYRNVAKVQIGEVTMEMDKKYDDYDNCSFDLKDIFVMNAKGSSHLFGGVTEGTVRNNWGDKVENKATTGITFYSGVNDYKLTQLPNYYLTTLTDAVNISGTEAGKKYAPTNATAWYIYENTDNTKPTSLVIRGDFKYKTNGENRVLKNVYYSAIINGSGSTINHSDFPSYDASGIQRNTSYTVNIKIAGTGSKDPTDPQAAANLHVEVKVVPFGTVSQTSVIE